MCGGSQRATGRNGRERNGTEYEGIMARTGREREAGHVDGGRGDALVVVRVDADALEFVLEAVLTHFERLELVLVHVRPPEQLRVEHVREVLASGHLHTPEHIYALTASQEYANSFSSCNLLDSTEQY